MVSSEFYGTLSSGQEVNIYTLKNSSGFSVSVINYGAIVTEIKAPDVTGKLENVVLGFDTLAEYEADQHCFGAICGRYAGRIKKGQFTIGDNNYQLLINDGVNTLHGGGLGFHRRVWSAVPGNDCVAMNYVSKDGEDGFPGEFSVQVIYRITDENELLLEYTASTTKPTIVNLTNHSYFNLSGCVEDVLNHELKVVASNYTPCNDAFIPTGEIVPVSGAVDFTQSKLLGDGINDVNGYNHNLIINGDCGVLRFAAELKHVTSRRSLQIYTTEPALMVYTANYLSKTKGENGKMYDQYYGVCLEAQHFPNSPNEPNFPTTLLLPGGCYLQTTVLQFGLVV